MMSPVIRGSSSTRAGRYPKTATFLPAGASALETLTGQPEAISVPVLRSVPPGLNLVPWSEWESPRWAEGEAA